MAEGQWQARRLHDAEALRSFLGRDPAWAAFALGDLDPRFFDDTEWAMAYREGDPQALALLYTGLEPPAFFSMGHPHGLALILGSVLRAPAAQFSAPAEHLPAIEGVYTLGERTPMWRMAVQPRRFRPLPGPAQRLTTADLPSLRELYRLGNVAYFTPRYVEEGVFYGVWRMGALVAAAGTHLVSEACGVAVVGNVFTHPQHRGQGLGTLVTSRVTEELLGRGLLVALNVGQDNAPALRIYEKLGYERRCAFIEALGERRPTR